MDYTDPADRRLRDEPTKHLSPEEAQIAAQIYQGKVLANLMALLQGNLTPNQPNHAKENPQAHN